MTTLDRALVFLRIHEGGVYTDDPNDPGGPTKWGVSLRFLRSLGTKLGDVDGDGDVDWRDVQGLTWEIACDRFWVPEFWVRYRYERLPDSTAVKTFDLACNMGPSQAHRCLQRALRACLVDVEEDGLLGPETVRACGGVATNGALLAALRSEAAGFYRGLVARRARFVGFETGWLNRAYAHEGG